MFNFWVTIAQKAAWELKRWYVARSVTFLVYLIYAPYHSCMFIFLVTIAQEAVCELKRWYVARSVTF